MNKKAITRFEQLIDDLQENLGKKVTSRPITLRLPVLHVAQIDILAGMKDVSRNVLLNEIVQTALIELLDTLKEKNPKLAATLEEKAKLLAKNMAFEEEPVLENEQSFPKKLIRDKKHHDKK
jgi:hypothetical protein